MGPAIFVDKDEGEPFLLSLYTMCAWFDNTGYYGTLIPTVATVTGPSCGGGILRFLRAALDHGKMVLNHGNESFVV